MRTRSFISEKPIATPIKSSIYGMTYHNAETRFSHTHNYLFVYIYTHYNKWMVRFIHVYIVHTYEDIIDASKIARNSESKSVYFICSHILSKLIRPIYYKLSITQRGLCNILNPPFFIIYVCYFCTYMNVLNFDVFWRLVCCGNTIDAMPQLRSKFSIILSNRLDSLDSRTTPLSLLRNENANWRLVFY